MTSWLPEARTRAYMDADKTNKVFGDVHLDCTHMLWAYGYINIRI